MAKSASGMEVLHFLASCFNGDTPSDLVCVLYTKDGPKQVHSCLTVLNILGENRVVDLPYTYVDCYVNPGIDIEEMIKGKWEFWTPEEFKSFRKERMQEEKSND